MEQDVYKDSVTSFRNLLRTNFGDKFKAYYEGDPIMVPDAAYPFVVVEKVSATVQVDATGTDLMKEIILIKIVMNKKDDLGASEEVDLTERKLRLLVEGRDVNGFYAPETIMQIIRTAYTLGSKVIENDAQVAYDIIPLGNGKARSEADISITLSERIIVPNRT